MKGRRLLQINVTANIGSTGRIAEAIGQLVINNGWDSYIAFGRESKASASSLVRIGSNIDTYAHYFGQRILDSEGLFSRHATSRFLSVIDSIRPSIIHLHNIHDHYLNYEALFEYLNKNSIPTVWTFHDCWPFTGHCFHFVNRDCDRWMTSCHSCPIRDYPSSLVDRSQRNYIKKKQAFLQNKNLTIVSCSNWLASLVQQSFFKNNRIQVIHNGIDTSVFTPGITQYERGPTYHILAVSNIWNKEKGLFDIYSLRSILPLEYTITIVGLSDKQIKSLPNGITGLPQTRDINDLIAYYRSADVLINLTYADTFPTVNIEALACGTPVITYMTGGSPEVIDSKTGIVVGQGDIVAVADAIRKLRKTPLSSKDCRKRAESLFDKDVCYKSYLNLYESLLSNVE